MDLLLLGLGANLGNTHAALDEALSRLDDLPQTQVLRASTFRSFAPAGGPQGQAPYQNGCAVVQTDLSPLDLLGQCQQIEQASGRQRGERWGARTLDIDLLLSESGEVCQTESLLLPHPRISFRRFVLDPAIEIAADWIHPVVDWELASLQRHVAAHPGRVAVVTPPGKETTETVYAAAQQAQVEFTNLAQTPRAAVGHYPLLDLGELDATLMRAWTDEPAAVLLFCDPERSTAARQSLANSPIGPHLISSATGRDQLAEIVGAVQATVGPEGN